MLSCLADLVEVLFILLKKKQRGLLGMKLPMQWNGPYMTAQGP